MYSCMTGGSQTRNRGCDETDADRGIGVSTDGESIRVVLDGAVHELTRDRARRLQDRLEDAMTHEREFLHTVGRHREDGTYVVSRRCADSTGNRKVFGNFTQLRRLFERLPGEFTADEVTRTGITGSRRHMLVRHFAEHPTFECQIVSRNPLTVRKTDPGSGEPAEADSATAD